MLGDLVIDVVLAHPGAGVEGAPVYRVIWWDPETWIYKLQLHRDPTGRALVWTWRNWTEISLFDEDDRWEELE